MADFDLSLRPFFFPKPRLIEIGVRRYYATGVYRNELGMLVLCGYLEGGKYEDVPLETAPGEISIHVKAHLGRLGLLQTEDL